ncbi:hypothetical protein BDQ17DRAFT_1372683 [Cyathus striatus]|nr:hypothetical protein BDQ17DRAFT_1372683 [Cyathus striatus]
MRSWTSLTPPKLTRKNRHIYCLITFVLFCIICISTGFGVGYGLRVKDFIGGIDGGNTRIVSLGAELISVDPVASTMVMDWNILNDTCNSISTCTPVNIYFDNNLLQLGGDGPNVNLSNQANEDPIFTWYPEELNDAFFKSSIFRTTSLLFNRKKGKKEVDSTLQDYPFDTYETDLFVYGNVTATNETITLVVGFTEGIAVGFTASSNVLDVDLVYSNQISFGRSGLIKTYVLTIVIGVWLVTLVFVGSTMKIMFRYEQPKEVFAVPIATLFAFTTLRGTMPGAPPGFGATIDFVGLLPCLAIITVTSVVLLACMVISNGRDEKSGRRAAPPALDIFVKTYNDPETAVEKPQDTATTPYMGKDTGSGRSVNSFLPNTTAYASEPL